MYTMMLLTIWDLFKGISKFNVENVKWCTITKSITDKYFTIVVYIKAPPPVLYTWFSKLEQKYVPLSDGFLK